MLTVTDDDGSLNESVFHFVVIYDPEGGFVTGDGWINSPEGAYTPDPTLTGKANFGFVCQKKQLEELETRFEDGPNYKISDMRWILSLDSDEQVRRLSRSGVIPGRIPGIRRCLWRKKIVDEWIQNGGKLPEKVNKYNVINSTFLSKEVNVTTLAGQGKLCSIELPTPLAVLHQLKVTGSVNSEFIVQVCEKGKDFLEAELSTIFSAKGKGMLQVFRLPDVYYEDKDSGTHLHLEITPMINQYLKPPMSVSFKIEVRFTPI